jgi:hypothetical protein
LVPFAPLSVLPLNPGTVVPRVSGRSYAGFSGRFSPLLLLLEPIIGFPDRFHLLLVAFYRKGKTKHEYLFYDVLIFGHFSYILFGSTLHSFCFLVWPKV